MGSYKLLIGMYDHKLGPICAGPEENCKWLKSLGDAANLIRDGLNTRSERFVINYDRLKIQIYKFVIKDNRLRGGTCRCCLFSIVPYGYPLLPEEILSDIIQGFKKMALENDNDPKASACSEYVIDWERKINGELLGDIGDAQKEHKVRNFLTVIKGYAQLLTHEDINPSDERHKEYLQYISRFTDNIINLYSH